MDIKKERSDSAFTLYKKDFKLLAKERFDLLKEFFQCDCIIKAKKIQANESKNYNAFSAHFKIMIDRLNL